MNPEDRGEPRDLAAAYVLDALDPADARAFEAQLALSAELRKEVTELREAAALIPLSAPSVPRDDAALKARLLSRVRGASAGALRSPRRSVWMAWVGWAAAAALAVVAGLQWFRASSLSEQLARREATLDEILEPSTQLILLTATGERPPGIQLFWNKAGGRVVLHAFNLPPAAQGRAYQLWFLRDGAPVPGGTFNSDPDGHALVTVAGPPADLTLIGAAVTDEPAGGSAQPTTTPVVVGTIGGE